MKKNLNSRSIYWLSTLFLTGSCGHSTGIPVNSSTTHLNCSGKSFVRNYGAYLTTPNSPSSQLKPLFGHVPLANQFSDDLGPVHSRRNLSLLITLQYQNTQDLDRELRDLYDPSSAKYHQFLTPEEFNSRFAPSPEQIALVKSRLIASGFRVSEARSSGILIRIEGKVQQVEDFFHTKIHRFRDPKTKAIFTAPVYELQAPADLPIRWVHGLDHRYHAQHSSVILPVNQRAFSQSTGLSPRDIKKAYSLDDTLDGSGQTLALVQLDTYRESDIRTYERQFGLGPVPLENRWIGNASRTPGPASIEVTLDLELMISLAPKAKKIMVYMAPNSAEGVIELYHTIAQDHEASVISSSWGMSETDTPSALLETENAIFKQFAAQGQSFFAASGDSGAYDRNSQMTVNDPASQPFVMGVGGTSLSVKSDGSYLRETAWGDTSTGGGGGGGVSAVWSQPSWQTGVISADSKGSFTQRNVPDVSLNSDPKSGYAIYFNGRWQTAGGTSCAAPLWAAFTALINQRRQIQGRANLGFPAPALYRVGRGPLYSTSLHDISDRSTNFYYPAVPNYDAATGWGSFQGTSLIQSLSQDDLATPDLGNSDPGAIPSGSTSAQPSSSNPASFQGNCT